MQQGKAISLKDNETDEALKTAAFASNYTIFGLGALGVFKSFTTELAVSQGTHSKRMIKICAAVNEMPRLLPFTIIISPDATGQCCSLDPHSPPL